MKSKAAAINLGIRRQGLEAISVVWRLLDDVDIMLPRLLPRGIY